MSATQRLDYWKRRARDAERMKQYTEDEMESLRRWMTHCFDRERQLADRCTFLYGAARAHGATVEELRGEG